MNFAVKKQIFMFKGHQLGGLTPKTLVYYNYRYYSPELGRWTKRDPMMEKGGTNVYGFINNSVISRRDRLGLNNEFANWGDLFPGAVPGDFIPVPDNPPPTNNPANNPAPGITTIWPSMLGTPWRDPYPSCISNGRHEGFFRHCSQTCALTKMVGPIASNIAAMISGGDYPVLTINGFEFRGDPTDVAANIIGTINAYMHPLTNCIDLCRRTYDNLVNAACCSTNIMISAEDPDCCP